MALAVLLFEHLPDAIVLRLLKAGIEGQEVHSCIACLLQYGAIGNNICQLEFEFATLAGSVYIPGATHGEVLLGNLKPVGCGYHDVNALHTLLRDLIARHEYAI